ncbi:MAG: hypothetical protein M1331_00420 [Candidatus Marsarchaeota archaeon]|nr:hypothetical protein [Candidatus Marsarchaeota archaeon]MCL5105850.1 hypothetical protein [Candidatus Marsarchaeota archaeon]
MEKTRSIYKIPEDRHAPVAEIIRKDEDERRPEMPIIDYTIFNQIANEPLRKIRREGNA